MGTTEDFVGSGGGRIKAKQGDEEQIERRAGTRNDASAVASEEGLQNSRAGYDAEPHVKSRRSSSSGGRFWHYK